MFPKVSISPSHPMRCAPMPCPVLPCSLRPRNGHDSAEFGNAIQNYYDIFGFDSKSRPRQRIDGGPLRLRTQVESTESARLHLRDLPQSLPRSLLRAGFTTRLSLPPSLPNAPRMTASLQFLPPAARQPAAKMSGFATSFPLSFRPPRQHPNKFAIRLQIYSHPFSGDFSLSIPPTARTCNKPPSSGQSTGRLFDILQIAARTWPLPHPLRLPSTITQFRIKNYRVMRYAFRYDFRQLTTVGIIFTLWDFGRIAAAFWGGK